MLAILADDLTGAAEIGGIAWRHGLSTEIQTELQLATRAEILVIDTDTRSCAPADAAGRVSAVVQACRESGIERFFMKVDSVLRGPVLAELEALIAAAPAGRALLVPANPGRGRTIQQGSYWINGYPLNRTDFANDPEYPTRVANVAQILLRNSPGAPAASLEVRAPGEPLPRQGILVGETASAGDLTYWARQIDDNTIPAGAAEFFTAYLAAIGCRPDPNLASEPPASRRVLFVCGSTTQESHAFCQRCESAGLPVMRMPPALFEPSSKAVGWITKWAEAVLHALQDAPQAVIAIDQPVHSATGAPQLLSARLAEAVEIVLAATFLEHLYVEGGATAAALVKRLGWGRLKVKDELQPGVVTLQIGERAYPNLTIKPGSYSWPAGVLRSP